MGYRAHATATPAYYLSRALVTLSIRNELAERAGTGLAVFTTPVNVSGARGALLNDIATAFSSPVPANYAPAQLAMAPRLTKSF